MVIPQADASCLPTSSHGGLEREESAAGRPGGCALRGCALPRPRRRGARFGPGTWWNGRPPPKCRPIPRRHRRPPRFERWPRRRRRHDRLAPVAFGWQAAAERARRAHGQDAGWGDRAGGRARTRRRLHGRAADRAAAALGDLPPPPANRVARPPHGRARVPTSGAVVHLADAAAGGRRRRGRRTSLCARVAAVAPARPPRSRLGGALRLVRCGPCVRSPRRDLADRPDRRGLPALRAHVTARSARRRRPGADRRGREGAARPLHAPGEPVASGGAQPRGAPRRRRSAQPGRGPGNLGRGLRGLACPGRLRGGPPRRQAARSRARELLRCRAAPGRC